LSNQVFFEYLFGLLGHSWIKKDLPSVLPREAGEVCYRWFQELL
jgi:hypothetical protein